MNYGHPKVELRPETCSTCSHPAVHPRTVINTQGKDIITEAHWCCGRCGSRFKIGEVSREAKPKHNPSSE